MDTFYPLTHRVDGAIDSRHELKQGFHTAQITHEHCQGETRPRRRPPGTSVPWERKGLSLAA